MQKEIEKAQAEGFIVQSNIKAGKLKKFKVVKDKKRGIMARIQEKIDNQEHEKEKQNEEDLMQQAMADPKYMAEIEALKNVKKSTEDDKIIEAPAPLTADEKA